MISTNQVSLAFSQRFLFQDVSVKFHPGHCYGLIGANGAGKSTFLKILSGEIKPDRGEVIVPPGSRVAVLKQNHFEFEDVEVIKTVLMGNRELFDIMKEKDELYQKPDFSEEDGYRAAELEHRFADLGGYDAESQAGGMLESLGVPTSLHNLLMRELEAGMKVRVLLAQAIFGNPDVLLLDEPTNNLDIDSIMWLEEFLCEFKNTVIVVSHDRHFLDKVSTHIADLDFNQISLYTGNYSFWYEASQLALKQKQDQNRKTEDKIKELKSFVERFSANASKSSQATSRKKLLDKLNIDEIKPSSRRYPHIHFQQEREAGKQLLDVKNLTGSLDGKTFFRNLSFQVEKGEKIAFVGRDTQPASLLLQILAGEKAADAGEFSWGVTTKRGYFPKDHEAFFHENLSLIEWLRRNATKPSEAEEEFLRGFLGKMLFSGPEVFKETRVLSGGEKVRCLLSRMMMMQPNVLLLDEPTNHLDLESITSLNNGLKAYKGTILMISQDRETVESMATRIIELTPKGVIDREMPYTEYLERVDITEQRHALYH
ncbi:MAG: ATP-binding cassette domain-containing protein [Pseudobdellovibrionaceae bacterium]|nr:ATP-binding cassette domain-containing protein [Pseudobdellovibrionaceae bacterium]